MESIDSNNTAALPPRWGSGECHAGDVLDASDGDAHCRWCGAIIPATAYENALSQRCCSAVCQALYGQHIGWFAAPIDANGNLNRSELGRLLKERGASTREKLLPGWFVEAQNAALEKQKLNRTKELRTQAQSLNVTWPRDWRNRGWKSEKSFLADMTSRIASARAELQV